MSDLQHLHRCHVKPRNWVGNDLALEPSELHHLLHVLRLRDGDHVTVFDGAGRSGEAELKIPEEALGKRALKDGTGLNGVAQLLSEDTPAERRLLITLIQALPKGKRMDLIVEKATELGAAVVQPVVTERVVAIPQESAVAEKIERWSRIALNASRQCGTPWIPEVAPIRSYGDVIQNIPELDLLLIGALGDNSQSMNEVLRKAAMSGVKSVGLIIGPEGDFTPAETEQACRVGAVPVSFGRLVLRVETAAIYGISVLAYELG